MIAFVLLQLPCAPKSPEAGLAPVLGRARALAAEFRYAEAIAALCIKGLTAADADLLVTYAGLIGGEEKLFKKVAERYEAGSATALAYFPEADQRLRVACLDGKGVGLVAEKGKQAELNEMRLTWKSLAVEQIFKLFVMAADMTSAEERLGLAVLAFHRGLPLEQENQLKVASALEDGFEEKAEQARAVLDRAKELRTSR